MDDLQNYIKSINPKKSEQSILIYGAQYRCFRYGKFIGVATWTKDENVGDSFQQQSLEDENLVHVFVADKWELLPLKAKPK